MPTFTTGFSLFNPSKLLEVALWVSKRSASFFEFVEEVKGLINKYKPLVEDFPKLFESSGYGCSEEEAACKCELEKLQAKYKNVFIDFPAIDGRDGYSASDFDPLSDEEIEVYAGAPELLDAFEADGTRVRNLMKLLKEYGPTVLKLIAMFNGIPLPPIFSGEAPAPEATVNEAGEKVFGGEAPEPVAETSEPVDPPSVTNEPDTSVHSDLPTPPVPEAIAPTAKKKK